MQRARSFLLTGRRIPCVSKKSIIANDCQRSVPSESCTVGTVPRGLIVLKAGESCSFFKRFMGLITCGIFNKLKAVLTLHEHDERKYEYRVTVIFAKVNEVHAFSNKLPL